MTNWSIVMGVLVLLLAIFLVIKEVKRSLKAHLGRRILASLLAVLALLCLGLPITCQQSYTASSLKTAVVLSPGYVADSVKRFLSQHDYPAVYTLSSHPARADNFGAVPLTRAQLLAQKFAAVHLFGWGFNRHQQHLFDSVPVVFHPSPEPAGVTNISWPQKLATGEVLAVSGRYNNTTRKKIKLVLATFGMAVDSVNLAAGSLGFTLRTTPRAQGRALYQLIALQGSDTIYSHPLPLVVHTAQPLRVLILAHFPDFENKFLKNWLAGYNYSVAVRTAISKNKYDQSFTNLKQQSLLRITPGMLSSFNVLVADAAELNTLSKGELAAIQNQVAQNGLGLVVKADTAVRGAYFYNSRFGLQSIVATAQPTVLQINDSAALLPAIHLGPASIIRPSAELRPMVQDRQQRSYVNSTLWGNGRIVLSTISNSYTWWLAGNQQGYSQFWSAILNTAVQKVAEEETWLVQPFIPVINQPVEVVVQTNRQGVPQATVGGAEVHFQQHPLLPFRWSGPYWPEKNGWQSTVGNSGNIFWWYAFAPADWEGVTALQRLQHTKAYTRLHQQPAVQHPVSKTRSAEVPKVWFLLAFVAGCAYLWYEAKKNQG